MCWSTIVATVEQNRKFFSFWTGLCHFSHVPRISASNPEVGTDTSLGAVYRRITDEFNFGENHQPSVTSIRLRWLDLQGKLSKFTGAYNQAQSERSSGQNDGDNLNAAEANYLITVKTKTPLKYYHL